MSVQILLQGKILGTEEFLLAGAPEEPLFAGRLRWVSLLSEVLPRALVILRHVRRTVGDRAQHRRVDEVCQAARGDEQIEERDRGSDSSRLHTR